MGGAIPLSLYMPLWRRQGLTIIIIIIISLKFLLSIKTVSEPTLSFTVSKFCFIIAFHLLSCGARWSSG